MLKNRGAVIRMSVAHVKEEWLISHSSGNATETNGPDNLGILWEIEYTVDDFR